VNPAYDLKELPQVPGARPDRVVLDAFKLGAAKLVAEAWEMDVAKVFAAVDTSQSSFDSTAALADEIGKKGADLSVAIPRFFKKDQADWGKKVIDKVS
jgi:arginyl-tRNA synthetase